MRSESGVLGQGLRVLRQGIHDERRIFTFAVSGSCLFGLATVATAYVVGNVVGDVIEPAFAHHRVDEHASLMGALAILAVAAARVIGIFGRRLGAGSMQYRLQARYRRAVTRRYLELPLAWHQRHATGTLLSNANADVEAAWYPIAPLPFVPDAERLFRDRALAENLPIIVDIRTFTNLFTMKNYRSITIFNFIIFNYTSNVVAWF